MKWQLCFLILDNSGLWMAMDYTANPETGLQIIDDLVSASESRVKLAFQYAEINDNKYPLLINSYFVPTGGLLFSGKLIAYFENRVIQLLVDSLSLGIKRGEVFITFTTKKIGGENLNTTSILFGNHNAENYQEVL